MKNKNLLSLLETVANQQEHGETAEFENLGAELAAKLKGGAGGPDDEEFASVNGVCTQNTSCGKSTSPTVPAG
jgi:hypothetical protein